MDSKLGKGLAAACGLAALLALGACGDRSGESAAERAVRNETGHEAHHPLPTDDAAAKAAAQRSGAAELAQGRGT